MTVLDLAIADAYLTVGATIGLGNAVTLRIQTWTDTAQAAQARLDAATNGLATLEQGPIIWPELMVPIVNIKVVQAESDIQALTAQQNTAQSQLQAALPATGGAAVLRQLQADLAILLGQANTRLATAQAQLSRLSGPPPLPMPQLAEAMIADAQQDVTAATGDTQLAVAAQAGATADQQAYASIPVAQVQAAQTATEAAQAAITTNTVCAHRPGNRRRPAQRPARPRRLTRLLSRVREPAGPGRRRHCPTQAKSPTTSPPG